MVTFENGQYLSPRAPARRARVRPQSWCRHRRAGHRRPHRYLGPSKSPGTCGPGPAAPRPMTLNSPTTGRRSRATTRSQRTPPRRPTAGSRPGISRRSSVRPAVGRRRRRLTPAGTDPGHPRPIRNRPPGTDHRAPGRRLRQRQDPRSSSPEVSSPKLGPATAGTDAPPSNHDLSAETLSLQHSRGLRFHHPSEFRPPTPFVRAG